MTTMPAQRSPPPSATMAEAPMLAIVDGTHLCLLPRTSISRRSGDAAVVVPALPLSLIWDRFHCDGDDDEGAHDKLLFPTANNTSKMEKLILRASDLLDDDCGDPSSSSSSSTSCRRISTAQLVRQSLSRIVNRSESGGDANDNNDKTSLLPSLRIVALHDDDDEILVEETTKIVMNADENRFEIHLLTFAAPPSDDNYDNDNNEDGANFKRISMDDDESVDCFIYGGEYYNLASEEDPRNLIGATGSVPKTMDAPPLTELNVIGAGSYLVADLFGVPGYEQVLVLPHLVIEDAQFMLEIAMVNDRECGGGAIHEHDDETLQLRTELLQVILEHSFITDGVTILHPVSSSQCASDNRAVLKKHRATTSSPPSVTIPPLVLALANEEDHEMGDTGVGMHLQRQINGRQSMRKIVIKPTHVESSDASFNDSSSTTAFVPMPTMAAAHVDIHGEISNALLTEDKEPSPIWLDTIAHTVEHRLAADLSEVERMERSAQVCLDLVNEGRATVHSAMRGVASSGNNSNDDPEVVRLRYGVRQRTSSIENACDGISVVMDLEVDVMLRPSTTANIEASCTEQGDEGATIGNSLHDFHLSCSLAKVASSSAAATTPPKTMHTVSGVVPTFQHGDCITILASVHLADMRLNIMQELGTSRLSSMLDMCIQGLWTTDDGNVSESKVASARHGAVLCILRLPVDTLFLAPPTLSPPPQANHWIQYEIDFGSSRSSQNHPGGHPSAPQPSAVFEYRSPRTLSIDTSTVQDVTIWKDLVSSMNARIGGNSFIDLYWKKGDPRLNLVIFGSNMEERAGELNAALQSSR